MPLLIFVLWFQKNLHRIRQAMSVAAVKVFNLILPLKFEQASAMWGQESYNKLESWFLKNNYFRSAFLSSSWHDGVRNQMGWGPVCDSRQPNIQGCRWQPQPQRSERSHRRARWRCCSAPCSPRPAAGPVPLGVSSGKRSRVVLSPPPPPSSGAQSLLKKIKLNCSDNFNCCFYYKKKKKELDFLNVCF